MRDDKPMLRVGSTGHGVAGTNALRETAARPQVRIITAADARLRSLVDRR
jgi:hypothetical protein